MMRSHATPRLTGRVGLTLPFLGRISAGRPIEAVPSEAGRSFYERINVPGLYELHMSGDSMIEAGIFDGDTVLIRPSETARNGQIVVALVDGQNATLRRLYARGDTITLKPEHPTLPPRRYAASRVQVQGILYCVARFYR